MDEALIRLVWQRASHCCEYCQMPQNYDDIPFEVNHIIARKVRSLFPQQEIEHPAAAGMHLRTATVGQHVGDFTAALLQRDCQLRHSLEGTLVIDGLSKGEN
jgi:hypothetical protein